MNKTVLNKTIRVFALVLLAVFALSFFHSELTECSLHEDHHDSHDYCHLIKGTVVHSSAIDMAKVFNFGVEKESFVDLNDNFFACNEQLIFRDYYNSISPPFKDRIYKSNMTFLI